MQTFENGLQREGKKERVQTSAYAKYLLWWIIDTGIREDLLEILFHFVSQKRMWQKPFQQNSEWQLLRWIWRILHVLIYGHRIRRRSTTQEAPYDFSIGLRIREQILLSHAFPHLQHFIHFFRPCQRNN